MRDVVDANGIRTIVADWGTNDDAIGDLMRNLQGGAPLIPFLAVFPAGQPKNVIRLGPTYTRGQVIDALTKAGASTVGDGSTAALGTPQSPAPLITSKLP